MSSGGDKDNYSEIRAAEQAADKIEPSTFANSEATFQNARDGRGHWKNWTALCAAGLPEATHILALMARTPGDGLRQLIEVASAAFRIGHARLGYREDLDRYLDEALPEMFPEPRRGQVLRIVEVLYGWQAL